MGCWNETCALTNLPILAGDPVAVVLLAGRTTGQDLCYADGLFAPIAPVFFGTYDDYGNVENIKASKGAQSMIFTYDFCKRTETGYDVSKPPQNISIDEYIREVVDIIRDGRYIDDGRPGVEPQRVYTAFIRKEFYDFAQERAPGLESNDGIETAYMFASRQLGLLRTFTSLKLLDIDADLNPLIKMHQFLDEYRIAWRPSAVTGQDCVDEKQIGFYEKILRTAQELAHRYD